MTASDDLRPAPLFTDVRPGPEDGAAWWLRTSDGLRLRAAAWARDAARGTVLLMPGRSEYVEKYAPAAADLAARGYATISIDWRGQGLADRLIDDPLVGHVNRFADYQKDVAALLRLAQGLDLPRPWFLLGHSMGGCIALRAAMEGLPVRAAAFTGPMWGIRIAPHLRPVAWTLCRVMPRIGLGTANPPSTTREPYVRAQPFRGNALTRDAEMYQMMRDQLDAHEGLALGGPSYVWLRTALDDCARLAAMPSPDLPCVAYLGACEQIVDVPAVHDRMERWPGGRLEVIAEAEHEVLMERPETRHFIFDDLARHFAAAA